MGKYVIGLDYGTNSCRSLIIDVADGRELASHVFPYPSGNDGVIVDANDPNFARQNPADYVKGIDVTIVEALKKAKAAEPAFSPSDVIGIGVDTSKHVRLPSSVHNPQLMQRYVRTLQTVKC
jgi:L-ribulokinase